VPSGVDVVISNVGTLKSVAITSHASLSVNRHKTGERARGSLKTRSASAEWDKDRAGIIGNGSTHVNVGLIIIIMTPVWRAFISKPAEGIFSRETSA
jgi:hypothetical protein